MNKEKKSKEIEDENFDDVMKALISVPKKPEPAKPKPKSPKIKRSKSKD